MITDIIKENLENNILEFYLETEDGYDDYDKTIEMIDSEFSEHYNISIVRKDEIFEVPSNWGRGFRSELSTSVFVKMVRK